MSLCKLPLHKMHYKMQYTLSEEKSQQKMANFFLPTIFFNDNYFYRHFFYKREDLVFSNLKIPLVYLVGFRFD